MAENHSQHRYFQLLKYMKNWMVIGCYYLEYNFHKYLFLLPCPKIPNSKCKIYVTFISTRLCSNYITAWKVFVFEFLWSIFCRIRTKYGPEKLRVRTLSTQCMYSTEKLYLVTPLTWYISQTYEYEICYKDGGLENVIQIHLFQN